MTRKKQSAKSSVRSRKASLGDLIMAGMKEGVAHARGEVQLRTRVVSVPDAVNVRAVLQKLGISQSEFAARYGFRFRTVQEWEQGRAIPDSAVRAYLTVIERNPNAVIEALSGVWSAWPPLLCVYLLLFPTNQILVSFPFPNHAPGVVLHQHLRSAEPGVIVRRLRKPIGSRGANGEHVSRKHLG
jgi:putative transcriptional regulator